MESKLDESSTDGFKLEESKTRGVETENSNTHGAKTGGIEYRWSRTWINRIPMDPKPEESNADKPKLEVSKTLEPKLEETNTRGVRPETSNTHGTETGVNPNYLLVIDLVSIQTNKPRVVRAQTPVQCWSGTWRQRKPPTWPWRNARSK